MNSREVDKLIDTCERAVRMTAPGQRVVLEREEMHLLLEVIRDLRGQLSWVGSSERMGQ